MIFRIRRNLLVLFALQGVMQWGCIFLLHLSNQLSYGSRWIYFPILGIAVIFRLYPSVVFLKILGSMILVEAVWSLTEMIETYIIKTTTHIPAILLQQHSCCLMEPACIPYYLLWINMLFSVGMAVYVFRLFWRLYQARRGRYRTIEIRM